MVLIPDDSNSWMKGDFWLGWTCSYVTWVSPALTGLVGTARVRLKFLTYIFGLKVNILEWTRDEYFGMDQG